MVYMHSPIVRRFLALGASSKLHETVFDDSPIANALATASCCDVHLGMLPVMLLDSMFKCIVDVASNGARLQRSFSHVVNEEWYEDGEGNRLTLSVLGIGECLERLFFAKSAIDGSIMIEVRVSTTWLEMSSE